MMDTASLFPHTEAPVRDKLIVVAGDELSAHHLHSPID